VTHTVGKPVLQLETIFGFQSSYFVGKVANHFLISIGRRIHMIMEVLIFGIYPLLSLIALFALRRGRLTGITQVLWALVIVAVPFLGALAFFIVTPDENTNPK
jgi:hypothetical protein